MDEEPEKERERGGQPHRPEDRVPRLSPGRQRTLNFGMSLVYWAAAAVCFLVAVTVLTNLGSGEKPDSEYLLVAGGAAVFGLLLLWTGFRSWHSVRSSEQERNRDRDHDRD